MATTSISLSPLQAVGHYEKSSLQERLLLDTAPGLRPAGPLAPAIHPPSLLGGILAVQ